MISPRSELPVSCPPIWFGQGGQDAPDPLGRADYPDAAPRRRRALIVEDEILIALHLEEVLQDLGLEVSGIVATGQEAVDAALGTEPDLIFMDVNLRGDMDGVEAARLARQALDVPIIFVTAYGDDATLTRITAAVPEALVLQKPPLASALAAAILKVGRR